ncbi:MAG: sigma-70 family RNA polymerase sigma factor [Flavobacteriales bacterium]|nr:sigma-70 family RNA polymerase sigma factor [Flavobacteriales bacterium]
MTRREDYTELTDELLMVKVADGESTAFSELYDRYATPLINYFYRMLWRDRAKAEDFMQELFTKLIHKPHLYNPERKFKTWLYSIANNMCKNEYRRMEVRKNTSNGLDERSDVKDNNVLSDKLLDRTIFNDKLNEELLELSENHRSVFELRYREDLSIKEIAEIMECSEGTIKSRLFYTIKKLSDKLTAFNPKLAVLTTLILSDVIMEFLKSLS